MDSESKKILALGLWGTLGFLLWRNANASAWGNAWDSFIGEPSTQEAVITGSGSGIAETIWNLFGAMNMKTVDKNLINHPQIQAFLRVIRKGEGTSDPAGYYRLFGGGRFNDTSWHPNIRVPFGNTYSTAAGAYQFLYSTWAETAKAMGLTDFSPLSQDLGALGRLAYRGAIDDIVQGNFDSALKKTAKEWASLPYSPYGQPTISMQTALNTFTQNGGLLA